MILRAARPARFGSAPTYSLLSHLPTLKHPTSVGPSSGSLTGASTCLVQPKRRLGHTSTARPAWSPTRCCLLDPLSPQPVGRSTSSEFV